MTTRTRPGGGVAAALLAVALLAAGCSSTSERSRFAATGDDGLALTAGGDGDGGADSSTDGLGATTDGGTGTSDGSGSTAGGPGGTGPGGAGPNATTSGGTRGGTGNGTAATGDTSPIKLGYAVVDLAGFSALSGSQVGAGSSADTTAKAHQEMQALVKWANDTGGVGGRRIEAKGYEIPNADTLSDDKLVAKCVQATEDDKVKAFIDLTVMVASQAAVSCFAKHRVNFTGNVQADENYYRTLKPFVGGTAPSLDRVMPAYVNGLKESGFFDGARVGVVMDDRSMTTSLYENRLLPALKAIGVTPVATAKINPNDQGLMHSQSTSAVLAFSRATVTHVLPLLWFFTYVAFTSEAQAQTYFPRYGYSDYYSVTGIATVYGNQEVNKDAIAVTSANFVYDTKPTGQSRTEVPRDEVVAYRPAMARCYDILSKYTGRNYYSTSAQQNSFAAWYCDHFFLWIDAARNVGTTWSPDTWGAGVAQLGNTFQSTIAHSTFYAPGRFDGAATYRAGKYDAGCRCFVVVTPWRPMS